MLGNVLLCEPQSANSYDSVTYIIVERFPVRNYTRWAEWIDVFGPMLGWQQSIELNTDPIKIRYHCISIVKEKKKKKKKDYSSYWWSIQWRSVFGMFLFFSFFFFFFFSSILTWSYAKETILTFFVMHLSPLKPKSCADHNSHTVWYNLIIFGRDIYQVRVSHARITIALFFFLLSPLNEFLSQNSWAFLTS